MSFQFENQDPTSQFRTLLLPFQTQTRQVNIRKPLNAQKDIAHRKPFKWLNNENFQTGIMYLG